MRLGALFDQHQGRCVVRKVWKAGNAWERMRGLLGRPRPEQSEALLIEPCRSVHSMGMRYALDLIYIDRAGCVCKLVYGLKPWQFSASLKACATLELAEGALAATGIQLGDIVAWREGTA